MDFVLSNLPAEVLPEKLGCISKKSHRWGQPSTPAHWRGPLRISLMTSTVMNHQRVRTCERAPCMHSPSEWWAISLCSVYCVWHGCHYWFSIIERETSYFFLGILPAIRMCSQQLNDGNLVMVKAFLYSIILLKKNCYENYEINRKEWNSPKRLGDLRKSTHKHNMVLFSQYSFNSAHSNPGFIWRFIKHFLQLSLQ